MGRNTPQPPEQRPHFALTEHVHPASDGIRGGLLGGTRAGPPLLGEHDQPGPRVTGMRSTLGISLAHDLVDELTRGLLGHTEVDGEVGDRRAVRGQPGEREQKITQNQTT